MLRKLVALGVFVAALAPSAYLAVRSRAMPQLGFYHDDSLYWVSAKSLAEGNGYRIASLPGQPYQTKYPPLYPALLALIWKVDPSFPGNLPLATLFAWLLFPLYLAAVWWFLKDYQLQWPERCLLLLVAASSPMAVLFSVSLMPELLFTALFLTSALLAERCLSPTARTWLPVVAGICGGLAYLTKSSAGPLLLTAPLYFAYRKQYKNAALFFAAMAPCVLGWQWWTAQHVSRSWDLVTLYYTNYVGFQIYNVSLRDLPLVVWHNLDGFLLSIGKLLTFNVVSEFKPLERVVAVAAIVGSVRLAKQSGKLHYPLAALGLTAILLVWHYPPDQRFVFPICPLLLAGLWTEIDRVRRALAIAWRKPAALDRAVACACGGALAAFAVFLAFNSISGLSRFLPAVIASHREALRNHEPAYRWISSNSPPGANVFAYDDPMLYLYTGRKSCSLPIPPKLFYHGDNAGLDPLLQSIPDFAHHYDLSFLLLMPSDFYRDLQEHGATTLAEAVEHSPAFQPAFKTPAFAIYRYSADFAPASLTAAR